MKMNEDLSHAETSKRVVERGTYGLMWYCDNCDRPNDGDACSCGCDKGRVVWMPRHALAIGDEEGDEQSYEKNHA